MPTFLTHTEAMNVLVIEDDEVLGRALDKGLREAGNQTLLVNRGRAGLEEALSQKYDVVVLTSCCLICRGLKS